MNVFSDSFRVRVSLSVLAVFGNVFHLVFRVFWSRAQKAKRLKLTHLPSENVFFKVRAGTGLATGRATGDPKRHPK